MDVSGCRELFGPARTRAADQGRHPRRNRLAASVGGPQQIPSQDRQRPGKTRRLVVVDPLRIEAFLDPLPIGRLWGVGKVTEAAMRRLGVETIGQLRTLSVEQLRQQFGEGGDQFWRLARGIDQRSVVPDRQAKEISHETTFARDLTAIEPLRHRLWELTDQVARRMRRSGRVGRAVQLKLRLSDFRTITRSHRSPSPATSLRNFGRSLAGYRRRPHAAATGPGIRLIGLGVSGRANPPEQQQLSPTSPRAAASHRQLDQVTDYQSPLRQPVLTFGRSLAKPPEESIDALAFSSMACPAYSSVGSQHAGATSRIRTSPPWALW